MAFRTLISTDDLAAHLADPSFLIVDCRFRLDDVAWGEREFRTGHIPGAAYAHLDRDLSGAKTGANGRHPLPSVDALAATLGRLGVTNGVQVVAYDQDTGMWASRLWWLLRWLGHDTVAVLDGGLAKWRAEGRTMTADENARPPQVFRPVPRPEMIAESKDVATHLGSSEWRLLDARAPERYRGDVEPIDRVAGHIPGAINHPLQTNLGEGGTFRPAEALQASFRGSLGDVPPERAINYCGSGVTACHNLLALEHAGLPGARLYPGSWSEWSSDPERPVEKS